MNLSARQLRAFVALCDERHFTRAAQRCHLTQPAFSALIRSLEQDAGARLFDRNTRRVDLTPEGRVLEAWARRLLADIDLALHDLQDHVARRRGRVALAALPSLAAGWLPGVLADYRRQYPGVDLELRDALLDPCLDMVQGGTVEFAVAAQRADMTDLQAQFLHADHFYLVCREDHRLARQDDVRLRDLAGEALIQLARNSSVRQHLDAASSLRNARTMLEVEHLATVTGLVAAGLGVTVVPGMTLFHFRRPGLAVRPLAGRVPTRALYLVKRRGRALSVAARTLYDMLLERRHEMGAQVEAVRSAPAAFSPSSIGD